MTYSCSDFTNDIEGAFPNCDPDPASDSEVDLAELAENILCEVDRLRAFENDVRAAFAKLEKDDFIAAMTLIAGGKK